MTTSGEFLGVPYVAIGNDELAAAPKLAEVVHCKMCGADHEIESSAGNNAHVGVGMTLHFYKCGDATYLAVLNGKAMP